MPKLFNTKHYIAIGTLLCEARIAAETECNPPEYNITPEMWAIDDIFHKFSVMFQKDNPKFDPACFDHLYMTGKITRPKKKKGTKS